MLLTCVNVVDIFKIRNKVTKVVFPFHRYESVLPSHLSRHQHVVMERYL
ncbi:MAG: hypothetical protein K9M81_06215 [Chthoniobacterales bacterium]|nr:hypothetical protein [Chthoniobacterales bacterium]